VLQQVAEPQRLYDQPENLFVAGFIGTPPMNLLEVRVSSNGGVSIELGGTTLEVPDQALKAYPGVRGYGGRTVIAGLRSQFIHPASERADLPTIEARIDLVEALGAESIAYFRIEAKAIRDVEVGQEAEEGRAEGAVGTRPNLVAQFPAHIALRLGSTVPVAVDVGRLHFFDAETGDPLR